MEGTQQFPASESLATMQGAPQSALAVGSRGVDLKTLDDIWRLAGYAVRGQFAPKGMDQAQALVAIQYGMELGITPMQALQSIAVINGRPSLWGDAVPALVYASGLCVGTLDESFAGDGDNFHAVCTGQRKGTARPVTRTFSVADAKKAGLWGKQGPWQQYAKRMLQMRARSWCVRDAFPDVLKGVAVAEEQSDIPAQVVVTEHPGRAQLAAAVGLSPEPPVQHEAPATVSLPTVDLDAAESTPPPAEQAAIHEAERLEYERILAGKLSSELIPGATERRKPGGKRKPGEGY